MRSGKVGQSQGKASPELCHEEVASLLRQPSSALAFHLQAQHEGLELRSMRRATPEHVHRCHLASTQSIHGVAECTPANVFAQSRVAPRTTWLVFRGQSVSAKWAN